MTASFKAFSCSCGADLPIKEEFNRQGLVVSGRIISSELVEIDSTGEVVVQNERDYFKYQFRRYHLVIKEVYKGQFSQDTIAIYSSVSDASCGYYFEVDKSFLVYGIDHEVRDTKDQPELPSGKNLIWTHLCTRTKEYDKKEANKLKRLSR